MRSFQAVLTDMKQLWEKPENEMESTNKLNVSNDALMNIHIHIFLNRQNTADTYMKNTYQPVCQYIYFYHSTTLADSVNV